ncbi:sugar transferase [Loktanella sp. DJP18]|uniref:sugar transferase n=1 Tax=Loktanella sp. DJP18 TaxID=3409788 RepID=UPI003BB757E2
MTTRYRTFPPSLEEIVATTDLNAPDRVRPSLYRLGLKRTIDTVIVLFSMPFTLPTILVLAFIIRCSGGPAFYFQNRIGLGGKIYRIWKIRTMVANADDLLIQHLRTDPLANAEWEGSQKLKVDPRITPFGRFLRKSSLDELPQLFNVLKGEMSLVGPRPMLSEQEAKYPGTAYYELRPGITGYWQISDRNNTAFADRAFYDTRYNRDLSLSTDFKILSATVAVVVRGTGY